MTAILQNAAVVPSHLPSHYQTFGPGPALATGATNLNFILECLGCSVGLGNMLRFPYHCHKCSGGKPAYFMKTKYFNLYVTMNFVMYLYQMSNMHLNWLRLAHYVKHYTRNDFINADVTETQQKDSSLYQY